MNHIQINKIRRRVEHSLSPYTAAIGGDGLTLYQLTQFVCFHFFPSDVQLRRLLVMTHGR